MGLPVHATTACGRGSCGAGIPATASCWPATEAVRDYLGRAGYAVDAVAASPSSREYLLQPAGHGRGSSPTCCARPRPAGPAELLRAARMGDGLPQRARSATSGVRCGWARRAPTRWCEVAGPLRCSHFDAFRFFTAEAAPRNATALTRDDAGRTGSSRAACTPTWICTSGPTSWARWSTPRLLLDCLELAAAAPRDSTCGPARTTCSGYGYTPIRVEEPAGRAEYVRCQSDLAQRAAPLRAALRDRCDLLLARRRVTGLQVTDGYDGCNCR